MAFRSEPSNDWGNQEFEREEEEGPSAEQHKGASSRNIVLHFMSAGPATLEVASIAGHVQFV